MTSPITDNDLRDLLWRMGMSPIEIETHLANPYLEAINRRIAAQLAQRLVERLFPEWQGHHADQVIIDEAKDLDLPPM